MRTHAADHTVDQILRPSAIDRHIDNLAQRVAHLLSLPPVELEAAWKRHCRGKPPAGLPRGLLARLLAYRVQAEVRGDLSSAVQRFLDRVGKEVVAGRVPDLQFGDASRLKPGTVLVREHGGAEHRVMVLAEGYAWNGQVHNSLSAVASAITGTRWNGHRFFGLDKSGAGEPTRTRPTTSSSARPNLLPVTEAIIPRADR